MTLMYLDKIWSSVPRPLIIIDKNDLIVGINPAAEVFFNVSDNNIKGLHYSSKLGSGNVLVESVRAVRVSQGNSFINNISLELPERVIVGCNFQLSILTDYPNHILIGLDVPEIDYRVGYFFENNDENSSASQLVDMLSHEVKNPLAGIIGAAQLLIMNLSKKDCKLADLIIEESRRVESILDHVSQFGKFKSICKKPENIHLILDRAKTLARYGFASGATITENYDPSLPMVHGDFDLLLQTFLNLLKNAVEASGNQKPLINIRTFYEKTLSVRGQAGLSVPVPLNVEISDKGTGFPDNLLSKAFEPFVSSKVNGSGFGLAIVSKIIREHNGWISIRSVSGETVIRISLPVSQNGG
jgi:two-component system nitrogen regulation sensor histidine kinase GlnL